MVILVSWSPLNLDLSGGLHLPHLISPAVERASATQNSKYKHVIPLYTILIGIYAWALTSLPLIIVSSHAIMWKSSSSYLLNICLVNFTGDCSDVNINSIHHFHSKKIHLLIFFLPRPISLLLMEKPRLMFLIIILLCMLCCFININTEAAPQGSLVTSLPGFSGSFPSKHYAGYVFVFEKNHNYLLIYAEARLSLYIIYIQVCYNWWWR